MWSPFGPFWSVKYLNGGQKLLIWTAHHNFLESTQPEVTKNPYYVLTPEWSQKKVSNWVKVLIYFPNKNIFFSLFTTIWIETHFPLILPVAYFS